MRKAAPIILIVGFAALLVYLFMGMETAPETAPGPISLPEQIGGFKQVALLTGEDGMLAFDQQHKKRVPIKEGAKATYSDGTVEVDLWVGNGAGPTHATQMFMDMAAKIGPENPVFSQPKPVELGPVNGYRTEGQQATNFFFTKNGRVYFIAVRGGTPEEIAKRFVSELLQ